MFDGPETHSPDETRRAWDRLRTRPSLETTEQRLLTAIREIAGTATALDAAVRWQWRRSRDVGGTCPGPYENTAGRFVTTRSFVSDIPIADAHWNRLLRTATDIAANFGMDRVEMVADAFGNHDVSFTGEDGNLLRFGTFETAVLRATSGCRLTRADLDRAAR
ncbi:LppA family lipoprotein [Nocardia takedensis]|uniref:LppA family lipoprotein n=1 Tax=Nocardia takedensis TaxID=259390 RepID=UPI000312845C|nr:LppA family lipoprotein [Nocardia takedensis]